jgi:hypothetical protein
MTDRVADAHETLGRRILAQYVVSRDPTAVVYPHSGAPRVNRARPARATVDVLLAEVGHEVPPFTEQVEILAKEPGSAQAFRAGTRLLAAWLDRHPARVPAVVQAADEAERASHLAYHLGDLVGTEPELAGVSADRLAQLPAPGLNPAKDRAELAVIVPVGFPEGQPHRLRNCLAVLHALNRQHLDRSRYRVVVVEQGPRPRADEVVAGLVDDYVFAPNPGPFNKSWAFNLAVNTVDSAAFLCLLDADALPDGRYLGDALHHMHAGGAALQPFSEALYLDEASTAVALHQVLPLGLGGGELLDDRWLRGFTMAEPVGFSVWLTRERYLSVGGHDERCRGWGYEDREFHGRLMASGGVRRLPGMLPHLWHPRPLMTVDGITGLNTHLSRLPRPADGSQADGSRPGDPDRYRSEFERSSHV